MNTQPEALRLADALELPNHPFIQSQASAELRRLHEENTALRQAIEQAEKQEPVAWMSQGGDVSRSKKHFEEMGFNSVIPLYTAPPRKEWFGLTHDDVLTTWLSPDACKVPQCDKYHHFYLAIEAKLRERNT